MTDKSTVDDNGHTVAQAARYKEAIDRELPEAEAQRYALHEPGRHVPPGFRPTDSLAYPRIDVTATDTVWQPDREVAARRPDLGLSARDAAVIAHLHTRHGRDLDTILAGNADTFDMSVLYESHSLDHADNDAGLLGHTHRGFPSVETGSGAKNPLPVYEWVTQIDEERQRVRVREMRAEYEALGREHLVDKAISHTLAHEESASLAWQLFCAAMGVTVDTFEGIPGGLDPVQAVAQRAEAGDRAIAEVPALRDQAVFLEEMAREAVRKLADHDQYEYAEEVKRIGDWITKNLPNARAGAAGAESVADTAIRLLDAARTGVEQAISLQRAYLTRLGLLNAASTQPPTPDAAPDEETPK